jgi:hypothetical protein
LLIDYIFIRFAIFFGPFTGASFSSPSLATGIHDPVFMWIGKITTFSVIIFILFPAVSFTLKDLRVVFQRVFIHPLSRNDQTHFEGLTNREKIIYIAYYNFFGFLPTEYPIIVILKVYSIRI